MPSFRKFTPTCSNHARSCFRSSHKYGCDTHRRLPIHSFTTQEVCLPKDMHTRIQKRFLEGSAACASTYFLRTSTPLPSPRIYLLPLANILQGSVGPVTKHAHQGGKEQKRFGFASRTQRKKAQHVGLLPMSLGAQHVEHTKVTKQQPDQHPHSTKTSSTD